MGGGGGGLGGERVNVFNRWEEIWCKLKRNKQSISDLKVKLHVTLPCQSRSSYTEKKFVN